MDIFAAKGHRQWLHLHQNIGSYLAQELEAHWHFTGTNMTIVINTVIIRMTTMGLRINAR
jgi:hypothetical protein|tara:strand:- start:372 stop:551 length:180 start_codon:yes stop_codon:yes gene_type:complete